MPSPIPSHIGILGGGTAGYFAALALRKRFPDLRITLIESSKIPIIGVGEATTPPLVAFLHDFLAIDIHELYREVLPTWKIGIRFDWGSRGGFNYPFSTGELTEAHVYEGYIDCASLGSMLMDSKRVPIFRSEAGIVSGLKGVRFAYHLDNVRFVRFLKKLARWRRIDHLDAVIQSVGTRPRAGGGLEIDHLITEDGQRLSFDFYIDCTGFRSLLLEQTLGSPFHSYASSLYCDRAAVVNVPHDGTIKPYTRAETMNSGWCWNIPMVHEDHRGYVYSSAFCSQDEAVAELRAKNPGMSEPWFVKFRSGRHQDFWVGNVAALGNAYAFVEPLESTALHMIIIQVTLLLRLLTAERAGSSDHDPVEVNRRVGAHWDYLRWFLALHYRFNGRLDTPFWQHCREHVDFSGLAETVADYQRSGPFSGRSYQRPPDAIFGGGGLDVLLLGQDVPTAGGQPRLDRAAWSALRSQRQERLSAALSHREALALLRDRPELLDDMLQGEDSWCVELGRAIAD